MKNYIVLNPTENITALVTENTPIGEQRARAEEIMKQEPTVQQVGFVDVLDAPNRTITFRMAGGEFCGNATMCAAVLCMKELEKEKGPENKPGESTEILVNSLPVLVKKITEKEYSCCIEMPFPERVFSFHGFPCVELPGITHVICEGAYKEYPIREWAKELGTPALGIMFLEGSYLIPIVYVPEVETLFCEDSCASGTTAIGYYYQRRMELQEPGGILVVEPAENGQILLTGNVKI